MRDAHPSEPSVTIVSVCFNSSDIIAQMLESVPAGVPVILVDNGSADICTTKAIAARYGARLETNARNCGFGVACNQGAALAETEFLFFLNPDAALSAGTIEALLQAARRYPAACAFNPSIFDSCGHVSLKRSTVLLPHSKWLPRKQPQHDSIVPVLSGAALFVRREAFVAVGGFDPQIILYHEDDDLSLRLVKQCGALMYVRDSRVVHMGGASSGRDTEIAALKGWHMGRSRVYAARKHGRPLAFAGALGKALLQIASPLSWHSARSRAKHWNFLLGVLSRRAPDLAVAKTAREKN